MAQAQSLVGGQIFDLAALEKEMRAEEAYSRNGHTARTLIHEPDLRVVLIVLKAGNRIEKHKAKGPSSIQTVSGALRLELESRTVDPPAGALLALDKDAPHDVEAGPDSALLLTIGWNG